MRWWGAAGAPAVPVLPPQPVVHWDHCGGQAAPQAGDAHPKIPWHSANLGISDTSCLTSISGHLCLLRPAAQSPGLC